MESKLGSSQQVSNPPELRPFYMSQQKKQSSQVQIIQTYNKLNKTIDDLQIHIDDAIKKHEAEFLFAYRNHMKKIKKQLAQLRKRSDEQQKEFSSNDKIVYLEKQITIFREEALKLYEKLDQKSRETQELKMRLKIYEKENVNYEKYIKDLVKKVKNLELLIQQGQVSHNSEDPISSGAESPKSRKENVKYPPSINPHDNKSTLSINNLKSLESILQKYVNQQSLATAIQQIAACFRVHEQQLKQKTELISKQRRKMLPLTNSDGQLKEWFLECVRSIKKQIYKRKQQGVYSLPHVDNINDFLSIDKLRLLELFLTNQKLLSYMYLKMFPDRLTELNQMLIQKKHYPSEAQQEKQRNISMVDRPTPEYDLEEIEKPSIVMRKQRQPKSLLRNRVIIKNGKLSFSNM